MKIKIEKSIIENIVSHLVNFVEKKDNSSINSHIYIEANDYLTFKATDNETGIKIENENGMILESGIITINGKKLYDIIKVLKNDFIEIENSENEIIIKQNSSIYKLPTFNHNDFPNFPNTENMNRIEINSIKFINALKKVSPVIDIGNSKYELNGALIDILEDKINIVSTDTKRLAICELENNSSKPLSLIIPKKAINEINKLFFNEIEIYYDNINLIIKSNKILFFTKLINGNYPNYQRIIPQQFSHRLLINKQNFLTALKQITIISNEIKLTINRENMKINSISEDNNIASTQINITSELNNFEFAVNSKFIYDFLNSIDSDEFILLLNEPNIPFSIKEDNFSTIIMPLSI